MESYIAQHFPQYVEDFCLTEKRLEYVNRYNQLILDLKLVADNHEIYNLHRAMNKTKDVLHDIFDEMIVKWLLPHTNILEKKLLEEDIPLSRIKEDISRLRDIQTWKERIMYGKAKAFTMLSYLVSAIDILISVALIVLISQIAHIGEYRFKTFRGIIGFIAIVALVKVTLDRFWIIPTIDKIGRKWYRKRIAQLSNLSSRLVGIVFLLTWMNEKEYPVKNVLEVLEEGIVNLKK